MNLLPSVQRAAAAPLQLGATKALSRIGMHKKPKTVISKE